MEAALLSLLNRAYDVGSVQLVPLAAGEKPIVRVERVAAPNWVARLYPSDAGANATHVAHLLRALEAQQYPAERVVPTMGGDLILHHDGGSLLVTTYRGAPLEAWQPAHAHNGERAPSPPAGASHDHAALTAVGALLGRLHALDPVALAAAGVTRNGIDPAGELAWAMQCLAEVQGRVPPSLVLLEAQLHDAIGRIGTFEGCPRTLIHGDCHLGNLVVQSPGDYAFVDWDAAGWGYAVSDVGLLLSSCTLRGNEVSNRAAIEAVIDGYCSSRVPTEREWARLADAIRFRVLVTLACALEERISPDYSLTQQFYGLRYDAWLQHEERATTIAQIARECFERTAQA